MTAVVVSSHLQRTVAQIVDAADGWVLFVRPSRSSLWRAYVGRTRCATIDDAPLPPSAVAGDGLSHHVGLPWRTPFADAAFAVVVCDALDAAFVDAFFVEMRRVLRRDGRLVFAGPVDVAAAARAGFAVDARGHDVVVLS